MGNRRANIRNTRSPRKPRTDTQSLERLAVKAMQTENDITHGDIGRESAGETLFAEWKLGAILRLTGCTIEKANDDWTERLADFAEAVVTPGISTTTELSL